MSRSSSPHSGYHWQGQSPFFEGWYVRLLLPEKRQSFAFMYSIENPAGDRPYQGGAIQILGTTVKQAGVGEVCYVDQLACRTFPDVKSFWAAPQAFGLGQWGKVQALDSAPLRRPRPLTTAEFWQHIARGYQIHQHQHLGCIVFPGQQAPCRWQFTIQPQNGWGDQRRSSRATAGWRSFLPLFDPGWQVLLAKGSATGFIEWQGDRLEFNHALVYAEKNWGTSFPRYWFWCQANHFLGEPSLSVTAAGGERLVWEQAESVALVGIHYNDQFYEFNTLDHRLTWQIPCWGDWQLSGHNDRYWMILHGTTDDPGMWVYTPTAQGLQFNCRDTTRGQLTLQLGKQGHRAFVTATTETAGLEVGGDWG